MSLDRRRRMIAPEHSQLSILRQCELVSISRSGFYHRPAGESPLNLELMRLIDAQFLETPWYGSRQMARHLQREGYVVGRKRIRRLMAKMGLPLSPDRQSRRTCAVRPHLLLLPTRQCPPNPSTPMRLMLGRRPAVFGGLQFEA